MKRELIAWGWEAMKEKKIELDLEVLLGFLE
jgi:hypothetical protein